MILSVDMLFPKKVLGKPQNNFNKYQVNLESHWGLIHKTQLFSCILEAKN